MLQDIVTKGSTDRGVTLRILDSTTGAPKTDVVYNSSGIDLWYRREGAARVAVTEATLAALTTAHADGGFLHVSDGVYRLDLPDAAFATGANSVDFGGTVTGGVIIGGRVRLVDYSLEDGVRMGLTALPNVAAGANGGLPTGNASGQVALQDDGITAAKIATDAGTELGTAVWATTTRILTAGTNIPTLDAAATRAAVGLASANLDAQLDALPTAAENAAAVWGAGTRVLTAIDEDTTTLDLYATIRAAVGLSAANLYTQIGAIDTNVDSILLDTGTDGVVVASGSKTGYSLSSAGVDAIHDEAVDGATTLRESVRLANAVLGGKASGLATTEAIYRDLADTTDRVTATVDADGNRSVVIRDLT